MYNGSTGCWPYYQFHQAKGQSLLRGTRYSHGPRELPRHRVLLSAEHSCEPMFQVLLKYFVYKYIFFKPLWLTKYIQIKTYKYRMVCLDFYCLVKTNLFKCYPSTSLLINTYSLILRSQQPIPSKPTDGIPTQLRCGRSNFTP